MCFITVLLLFSFLLCCRYRRVSYHRWPNENQEEMPDCGLFFCRFVDGQDNFFTDEQDRIVFIYEASISRRP